MLETVWRLSDDARDSPLLTNLIMLFVYEKSMKTTQDITSLPMYDRSIQTPKKKMKVLKLQR